MAKLNVFHTFHVGSIPTTHKNYKYYPTGYF